MAGGVGGEGGSGGARGGGGGGGGRRGVGEGTQAVKCFAEESQVGATGPPWS